MRGQRHELELVRAVQEEAKLVEAKLVEAKLVRAKLVEAKLVKVRAKPVGLVRALSQGLRKEVSQVRVAGAREAES